MTSLVEMMPQKRMIYPHPEAEAKVQSPKAVMKRWETKSGISVVIGSLYWQKVDDALIVKALLIESVCMELLERRSVFIVEVLEVNKQYCDSITFNTIDMRQVANLTGEEKSVVNKIFDNAREFELFLAGGEEHF